MVHGPPVNQILHVSMDKDKMPVSNPEKTEAGDYFPTLTPSVLPQKGQGGQSKVSEVTEYRTMHRPETLNLIPRSYKVAEENLMAVL